MGFAIQTTVKGIVSSGGKRHYIDKVIMPHSTRRRIARALQMLRNKTLENPWKKHDNIPLLRVPLHRSI